MSDWLNVVRLIRVQSKDIFGLTEEGNGSWRFVIGWIRNKMWLWDQSEGLSMCECVCVHSYLLQTFSRRTWGPCVVRWRLRIRFWFKMLTMNVSQCKVQTRIALQICVCRGLVLSPLRLSHTEFSEEAASLNPCNDEALNSEKEALGGDHFFRKADKQFYSTDSWLNTSVTAPDALLAASAASAEFSTHMNVIKASRACGDARRRMKLSTSVTFWVCISSGRPSSNMLHVFIQ